LFEGWLLDRGTALVWKLHVEGLSALGAKNRGKVEIERGLQAAAAAWAAELVERCPRHSNPRARPDT